jgi:hypothetical protein
MKLIDPDTARLYQTVKVFRVQSGQYLQFDTRALMTVLADVGKVVYVAALLLLLLLLIILHIQSQTLSAMTASNPDKYKAFSNAISSDIWTWHERFLDFKGKVLGTVDTEWFM